jgi:hypothetical protein
VEFQKADLRCRASMTPNRIAETAGLGLLTETLRSLAGFTDAPACFGFN